MLLLFLLRNAREKEEERRIFKGSLRRSDPPTLLIFKRGRRRKVRSSLGVFFSSALHWVRLRRSRNGRFPPLNSLSSASILSPSLPLSSPILDIGRKPPLNSGCCGQRIRLRHHSRATEEEEKKVYWPLGLFAKQLLPRPLQQISFLCDLISESR